jgi:hypothetical protein
MYRFLQRLWNRRRQARCQPVRRRESRPRRFHPFVEQLDQRLLPSVTVTNTDQLRAAIAAVNAGTAADNVIDLAPGTYSTRGDTAAANRGAFVLQKSVILEAAPGGDATNVLITGANTDTVFNVVGNVTAEFDNLTIENGLATGSDGAGSPRRPAAS